MNPFDWEFPEWCLAGLAAALVLMLGLLVLSCRENDRQNRSVIGRDRTALVLEFGPPSASSSAGSDTEVIRWVRHEPGYFSSIYHSDGRGGGWTQMVWVPDRDVVRTAVVKNGSVVKCEGGF